MTQKGQGRTASASLNAKICVFRRVYDLAPSRAGDASSVKRQGLPPATFTQGWFSIRNTQVRDRVWVRQVTSVLHVSKVNYVRGRARCGRSSSEESSVGCEKGQNSWWKHSMQCVGETWATPGMFSDEPVLIYTR